MVDLAAPTAMIGAVFYAWDSTAFVSFLPFNSADFAYAKREAKPHPAPEPLCPQTE